MVDLKTAIHELNTGKIEFDYKDDNCCTTEGEVVILLKRLAELEENSDVVKVETVKSWLYEMAFNNVGCVVNGDFSDACEEIISRLDGLRSFARDKGDE